MFGHFDVLELDTTIIQLNYEQGIELKRSTLRATDNGYQ